MNIWKMKILSAAAVLFSVILSLDAQSGGELRLADIFCDGAIIQRELPLPIWGTDLPAKKIKVSFAGQELSATADKDGRWKVVASAVKEGGPFQIEVQSETGKAAVKDIYSGEVWIFAGESLLDRTIDRIPAEADGAPQKQIRYFMAPRQFARAPCDTLPGRWKNFASGTEDMPALAYYFADEIRRKLNVPVGIIVCSVPESLSHAWMHKDSIKGIKQLGQIESYVEVIQNYEMKISGTYRGLQEFSRADDDIRYSGALKRFQMWAKSNDAKKILKNNAEAEQWQEKIQDWVENSMQRESKGIALLEEQKTWPLAIQIASGIIADPRTSGARPSALFNGMINPLVPYSIKGFVFCQGESDASWERGQVYFDILSNLIKNWRSTWNKAQNQKKGDLPFIYMQLQGIKDDKIISAEECSLLRLSQASVIEKVNVTAMVVSYDIIPDAGKDAVIQPGNMKEEAQRLALSALGRFYNQKVVCSGPIFDSVTVGDGSLRLKFKYADSGLIAGKTGSTEKIRGFETGSPDGLFKEAEVTADKNFIVIKTPGVVNNVRYGWGLKPEANLYNKEGLPAVPFTVNLTDK
ncbi:MAG TPA: hypothetical protein DCZ94_10135 [Lentisphaeria bacterium]|nr:MAG: hypothetical protein A2X48_08540 [Lentisphaerae bacterium GWF2_49_21]HBC87302.1 hypothetical protein [Lentisphaeria bacterium]